jgi:hypothetical protein
MSLVSFSFAWTAPKVLLSYLPQTNYIELNSLRNSKASQMRKVEIAAKNNRSQKSVAIAFIPTAYFAY